MSATTLLTTEQFLALPDDGLERNLICGQVREKPMTRRNRFHTFVVTRIAYLLEGWLMTQPTPCGEVHTGEAGAILRREPDSIVGIDVAYFSAETMARQNSKTTMIDGVPKLAVEVLSPSDKVEETTEKVNEYLSVGVDLVWIIDPYFQTIQLHRRGYAPVTFNNEQRMTGGDILPGLDFAVIDVFQRPQAVE
ncbi:MAG: Uma2 family endonuclease [Pirellulaceae bacterium]